MSSRVNATAVLPQKSVQMIVIPIHTPSLRLVPVTSTRNMSMK